MIYEHIKTKKLVELHKIEPNYCVIYHNAGNGHGKVIKTDYFLKNYKELKEN